MMATDSSFHGPSLRFEVESESTVHCTGKITFSTSELLTAIIKPLLIENQRVVLDLAHVDHMDSAGLGTIVALYVSAKRYECQLRLVNCTRRAAELLGMTRLGEVLVEGREPCDLK